MKPLVIIPARGGSKGIPNKNIKLLKGKPLIHYTIEAALACFPKEVIIVSTDAEEIKKCAEQLTLNVPFLRPEYLATDTATSYDVILHAMNYANENGLTFDTVILLQPTSPFRNGKHIAEAISLYTEELDMVVSVKKAEENPYYSLFEETDGGFLTRSKEGNFTRRQDCPEVYSYNGAIYIMNAKSLRNSNISEFRKIRKYVMGALESVDLDTELDWKLAELIATPGKDLL